MIELLAAVAFFLALLGLWGGPRSEVLRGSDAAPRARPDWVRRVSGARVRFGLLAGVVCWLLLGQGWTGALVGAGAVPGAMVLLGWLEGAPQRRGRRQLIAQQPGCLDLLAAALEAGAPLRAAVGQVAKLAPEPSAELLRGVLGHLEIGRSDAQAWTTLRTHAVWGPAARDLARCAETGAALSGVLEVHASEARARRRALRESAARTVGVQSVLPLVCCFLPAFVLVGVVPIIAATLGSLTQGR